MTLAQLLSDKRDAIVRRFVAEIQTQEVPPTGTSRSNVVDYIPFFLDDVIRELRGQTAVRETQDVSDVSATASSDGSSASISMRSYASTGSSATAS